jgi:predicted amidohydrolase
MKIAAIQYRPPKGCPDRARAQLVGHFTVAAQAGAKLIVAPEMATTGYVWPSAEALMPHTEVANGATFAALSPIAVQHGAWIVCGFAERDGSALFNAAMVISPAGTLVTSYRKCLLYVADTPWAQAGEQRVIVDLGAPGWMVPAICMDLNDDGLIAVLRQRQPRFLAFCTNWVQEGVDPFEYWQRRVAGWQGWFIAANSWGEDSGTCFTGLSTIVGPNGQGLVRAPAVGDWVLIANVDDRLAPSRCLSLD